MNSQFSKEAILACAFTKALAVMDAELAPMIAAFGIGGDRELERLAMEVADHPDALKFAADHMAKRQAALYLIKLMGEAPEGTDPAKIKQVNDLKAKYEAEIKAEQEWLNKWANHINPIMQTPDTDIFTIGANTSAAEKAAFDAQIEADKAKGNIVVVVDNSPEGIDTFLKAFYDAKIALDVVMKRMDDFRAVHGPNPRLTTEQRIEGMALANDGFRVNDVYAAHQDAFNVLVRALGKAPSDKPAGYLELRGNETRMLYYKNEQGEGVYKYERKRSHANTH